MHDPLLKLIPTALAVVVGLSSCSSIPQHTNTLIFGSNTALALDFSQQLTGNYGFTLGFRRQEIVWLPLLANTTSASGVETPAACQSDACKSFNGTAGNSQHTGEQHCG
jgi:hypothetical protein